MKKVVLSLLLVGIIIFLAGCVEETPIKETGVPTGEVVKQQKESEAPVTEQIEEETEEKAPVTEQIEEEETKETTITQELTSPSLESIINVGGCTGSPEGALPAAENVECKLIWNDSLDMYQMTCTDKKLGITKSILCLNGSEALEYSHSCNGVYCHKDITSNMHKIIPVAQQCLPPCCGNEICESGETYLTCPEDCPNCDDSDTNTIDSYNFNLQKCEHYPIVVEIDKETKTVMEKITVVNHLEYSSGTYLRKITIINDNNNDIPVSVSGIKLLDGPAKGSGFGFQTPAPGTYLYKRYPPFIFTYVPANSKVEGWEFHDQLNWIETRNATKGAFIIYVDGIAVNFEVDLDKFLNSPLEIMCPIAISCDDKNQDTYDYCDASTDFKCVNINPGCKNDDGFCPAFSCNYSNDNDCGNLVKTLIAYDGVCGVTENCIGSSISLAVDDSYLFVGSYGFECKDCGIKVYDKQWNFIKELIPTGGQKNLMIDKNNNLLYACEPRVTVWNLTDWSHHIFDTKPDLCKSSPITDDNFIYTTSNNGTHGFINILQKSDNTLIKSIVAHNACVNDICSTPVISSLILDDDYLYSSSADRTIKKWSKSDWSLVETYIGHTDYVWSIAVDNNYLYSGSADKTVKVWIK